MREQKRQIGVESCHAGSIKAYFHADMEPQLYT